VVRAVENNNGLVIQGLGAAFPVEVRNPGDANTMAALTVDTAIRVRGACQAIWNDRRQLVGIRLVTPGPEQIEILKPAPADPFSIPVTAATNLMQWEGGSQLVHRAKAQGVVTLCYGTNDFFIQDASGAIHVQANTRAQVKPGDRVEVVGFPESRGLAASLSGSLVRAVGSAPVPDAPTANLDDLLSGRLDAQLVRTHARLMEQKTQGPSQRLALQSGGRVFYASLQTNRGQIPAIPVGSTLLITGVCSISTDANRKPQSFELFMNGPDSVSVLERPPWWSLKHTLALVAVMTLILFGAVGWIRILHRQVDDRTRALRSEIEERKRLEQEKERIHKELLSVSRRAGMADVATGVLHNVGNVLNSVNVSTNLLVEQVKASHAQSVTKLAGLFEEQAANLGRFLTEDERGRQVPTYLRQLAGRLQEEQAGWLREFESLTRNVDHIKEIVAMQQSYAQVSGVAETVPVPELMEDALKMHSGAYLRHAVNLVREYAEVPPITVDKHKVLQILVNLLHNAKYASDESGRADKQVTVRIAKSGADRVKIGVADNGIGIPSENLTRIFNHGFTTRKGGHGFGLHGGANAAKELGGSLTACSEGLGRGATFVLELPLNGDQTAPQSSIRQPEKAGVT
jgi:signal transduction histidine kinase